MTLTELELEKLEALHAAATPGRYRPECEHPDARFVAIACNYALPLVKAVREAWAEVERLRGIVEVNDRRLAAVWDEARAEVERMKANNQPDQVTE